MRNEPLPSVFQTVVEFDEQPIPFDTVAVSLAAFGQSRNESYDRRKSIGILRKPSSLLHSLVLINEE